MTTDLRKWVAFGSGVGIAIGNHDLQVAVVRVRPTGVRVLGAATIAGFRSRPATEWGAELLAFIRKLGAGHVGATVLLPRREVTVRQIELPGVADKDLDSAIQFQIDGLHPYPEDEAVYSFARLRGAGHVLVGITRREVVSHYTALFAEAGIKTAAFTFSAAAIYSAARVLTRGPAAGDFIAVRDTAAEIEIYGESAAKPVFSAAFDNMRQRAVALAIAELRLPPDTEPVEFNQVLPRPTVFPDSYDPAKPEFAAHVPAYASALSGSCPWLATPVNLLPVEQRRSTSRVRYVPTAVLGALLLLMVVALVVEARYEDSRYLNVVQSEIKKLEPVARRAETIDRSVAEVRARSQMLDDFRRRTTYDLDTLNEVTRLLEPPAWAGSLEVTRSAVQLSGEAETAAPLLQKFDRSPLFRSTEFSMGIVRAGVGEGFRLRTTREFPAPGAQAQPQPAPPAKPEVRP